MQKVKLNLIPQGVPPVVYASQYDVGRQFQFEIYEGDVEYEIPSDTVITIHGIKKDNHSFAYSTNDDTSKQIEFSGSLITIMTAEQMTLVPGDIYCEFVLRKNLNSEDILGTLNFIIHVEPCPIPEDAATSASDLQAYQDMVDRTRISEINAKKSENSSFSYMNKTLDYWSKGIRTKEIILDHTKWTGTDVPFEYDLGAEYAGYAVILCPSNNATDAQIKSWLAAEIYGSSDTTILYARKSMPTTDLPVTVIYAQVKEENT